MTDLISLRRQKVSDTSKHIHTTVQISCIHFIYTYFYYSVLQLVFYQLGKLIRFYL